MDSSARSSAADRRDVIRERAVQMQIDFTMVEKDFWVCWTLASLFDLPADHPAMTFKGGTSLSKAYGLIDRFSEDVDVVVDPWFFIGGDAADPQEPELSRTKRAERMSRLDRATTTYIRDRLLPTLRERFASRLDTTAGWSVNRDPSDPNALLFAYPKSDQGQLDEYVRGIVKIELGWRAKTAPSEPRTIEPYLAGIPGLFDDPRCACSVLAPSRTFWEKVTALHAESFRTTTSRFFSRHYSDVASMLQTPIGRAASRDHAMLEDVRTFKDALYHAAWARYDLAVPGSLVVVPDLEKLRNLAADYRAMSQMFLHEPPRFESVIERLRAFETIVNAGTP